MAFLISALLMQAFGWVLCYQLQQSNLQYEMQHLIIKNSNQFETLEIPLSKFSKSKINNNEIVFNGKLYDIKSIEIKTNYVTLIVINDTKEESILEQLNDFFTSNKDSKSKTPNQISKLFSLVFDKSLLQALSIFTTMKNHIFIPFNTSLITFCIDVFSLPPKL